MSDIAIGYGEGEFRVRVPFFMNETAKNAPDRAWDKANKFWRMPNGKANRQYLKRNFERGVFSEKALAQLEAEEQDENLGFFPADWPWPGEPMEHQLDAARFAWPLRSVALFHEMGLGKTYTAINLAGARWSTSQIDGVLVICPTSIKSVWKEEFKKFGVSSAPPVVHVHEAGGDDATEQFIDDTKPGMKVLVVGVESLSSRPAQKKKNGMKWEYQHSNSGRLAERFIGTRRVMAIVDESSTIKNARALRTELAWKFQEKCPFRVIMTGTDITQGIHDLYGQFRMLDWEIIGHKSYFTFQNRYCIMQPIPGAKGNAKKIAGYQNLEELMALCRPHVHQRFKEDCLDLPEKVYERRVVAASKEQKSFIRDMKKTLMAEHEGKKIEVKMALDFLLRCQQVAGGFFPYLEDIVDGKRIFRVEPAVKNPKLDELMRVLAEIPRSRKVIIWSRFTPEIEKIGETIASIYGKDSVGLFYGATLPETRAAHSARFQDPDSPMRFMVANQAVGGMGQTWTAATAVIYFTNSFSYQERMQSEDRAHRKGQVNTVTYIDIMTDLPVDRRVAQVLEVKGQMADFVDEALEEA